MTTTSVSSSGVTANEWAELQKALYAASLRMPYSGTVASVSGNVVTLVQDVTAESEDTSPITIGYLREVVLDLNGHTIDRGLTEPTENGCVIANFGNLTIQGTGTITGGNNSSTEADEDAYLGGGIYNGMYGTLTILGGSICDNVSATNGGGIYAGMGSGVITLGSTVSSETMEVSKKISITGNKAGQNGGGIYMGTFSGLLAMAGGTISANTAGVSGGGIYLMEATEVDGAGEIPQFKMGYGTIKGNTAGLGDGYGRAIFANGETANWAFVASSDYLKFYTSDDADGANKQETATDDISQSTLNGYGYISIESASVNPGGMPEVAYATCALGETATINTGLSGATGYEVDKNLQEYSSGFASVTLSSGGSKMTIVAKKPGTMYYLLKSDGGSKLYAIVVMATLKFKETAVTKQTTDGAFTNELTKNPSDLSVKFTSSDESVAKVNASTGEVTPLKTGHSIITATSADDDIIATPAVFAAIVVQSYKIHFEKNAADATGTMEDQIIITPMLINEPAFTRAGYTFAGWNTEADGSGTEYPKYSKYPADDDAELADVTLYAQWVEGEGVTIKVEDAIVGSDSPVADATTSSSANDLGTSGVFSTSEITALGTGKIGYLWFKTSRGNSDNEETIKNFLVAQKVAGNDSTVAFTVDIELWKRVSQGEDVQVTETTLPITVVIKLDDASIPSDPTKRSWYVVREHEGQLLPLPGTFDEVNKTISFPCNAFSDFSVVYTTPSGSQTVTRTTAATTTTTKSNGTSAKTTTTSSSKSGSAASTPATADNSLPFAAVAALVVLGCGLGALGLKRK